MGSFRHHGRYDFVRTDQRGWDLLDIMDVTTLYALTSGGGIFFFGTTDVTTSYAVTRGGGIF